MPADRIRQHRSLAYQKLPTAMQHQASLLFLHLDRHKPHRWPRHRLADRCRIVGVVLAALEIGLHIARRHQPHGVAERPTVPMSSTPCTWNTDFAISRPIVLTSPMDGSPQCGLLDATTLWHFNASERAPSTASLADKPSRATAQNNKELNHDQGTPRCTA